MTLQQFNEKYSSGEGLDIRDFYLVIKNSSLSKKYPGGIIQFIIDHENVNYNRFISVVNFNSKGGSNDFIKETLEKNNIKIKEDYTTGLVPDYAVILNKGGMKFDVDWLTAEVLTSKYQYDIMYDGIKVTMHPQSGKKIISNKSLEDQFEEYYQNRVQSTSINQLMEIVGLEAPKKVTFYFRNNKIIGKVKQ